MSADALHEMPSIRPIEATNHASRLALARFMVGQFFSAQPKLFREGIARSTARAGGLDLYAIGFQDQIIGGVMLCREGSTLGVYNLCIKPEFQNQGWGRAIIRWARSCGGVEGRVVTLQCDERLVPWYIKCGFSQIGEIVAFSRSDGGLFDTM
jgi:ribosomal protein S18 acetylase RimI-like enzyme